MNNVDVFEHMVSQSLKVYRRGNDQAFDIRCRALAQRK